MKPSELLDHKLVRLKSDSAVTVVHGGTILDGTGRRLERGSVVIRGMRIVSVGPSGEVDMPAGAQVIDAAGSTVMPGMFDAHIHFMGEETGDLYRRRFAPRENVKFIRAAFEVYEALSFGFTTVRALGHGPAEHAYALRAAIQRGLIRGPRIFSSGWALSQTRGHGDVPELPYDWVEHERPRSAFCDGEVECRKMTRRNFGEGADVIKVYSSDNKTGRPDFTVAELAAIADEAHRRGKRVATHAKTYDGVHNALMAGIDTIEHGPPEPHRDLLEMMLERGSFLVPTMSTLHLIATEGAEWAASPKAIDQAKRELEGRQGVARLANEMGVSIVTGSDAGARANFGLLSARELALLVDSGLKPMQAIASATSVAAQALGIAEDVGSIEAGKLADLIVLDGDPLSDITLFQRREQLRLVIQTEDPLTD